MEDVSSQDIDHEDVEPQGDPQPAEVGATPDVPVEAPEPIQVAEGTTNQSDQGSGTDEPETAEDLDATGDNATKE